MSEEAIIRHCSPTLAGLKTGNLFSFHYQDRTAMSNSIREWNRKLREKGIRVIPLRYSDGNTLIYMYRPSMLKNDMENTEADRLLKKYGYLSENCGGCVVQLIQRLAESKEFPHEIGLFLGYPPEDVDGFIKNRACGFKCVGCWKVYGDKERAEKMFTRFKKCSEIYYKRWTQGFPIERLTVKA